MTSIKNFKYIVFIFLAVISISCSRADEDADVLSQEDISNIILNVKNDASGISQTYNYTLNAATNPVIKLTDGANYTVTAIFKNGNEDERKTDGIYLMILTHFFLLNACEGEKNLDKKMNRSI